MGRPGDVIIEDERVFGQSTHACSHYWINPEDPPISRLPYSPVIGPWAVGDEAGRVIPVPALAANGFRSRAECGNA
jgi:hypothetical protein